MKEIINTIKDTKGQAMLLVIIVLTAAALVIGVNVLYAGLGDLDMGFTYQCGEEAFALTDGCIEESFRHLQLDPNFSGGTMNLGNGSCIINIVSNASLRTIYATSTVNNCSHPIETNITLENNQITVNTWK